MIMAQHSAIDELRQKTCQPCHGGMPPLDRQRIEELLRALPGWQDRADHIEKQFGFKDYYQTMAFVNAVAWIAHQEDHHPDLEVGYNKCIVRYSTHAVGGLSENDFICAAKVQSLLGG
jgi:4a-hydroxytetrahydrobiopterin dehydratase